MSYPDKCLECGNPVYSSSMWNETVDMCHQCAHDYYDDDSSGEEYTDD